MTGEACAKAKGVDDPAGFSLADPLRGLGASQEMEEADAANTKCPQCGFSQADFKKTGRLGCPECYEHFEEGIEGLLKTMHKGTRHTGKAPAVWQQTKAEKAVETCTSAPGPPPSRCWKAVTKSVQPS